MTEPVVTDLDLTWKHYAEASRQAMVLLGHPGAPACLPHETEPCGGGYGQHCAAQLAVIKALVDHQLEHLGMPEMAAEVYEHTSAELAEADRRRSA